MKKIILILSILVLIVITTFTKNSTKKLDNQIFIVRENIRVLKDKYELVLLDYNFLTSPKKLLEYQSKYFETDLIPLDITQIKEIKEENNKLVIMEFSEIKKGND
tara:strand:- start:115 stop:429 length:315 start_codon:yes stop_codon:yes gene_type:complete